MKHCPNCGEKIERGKKHQEKGYCRILCGQAFEICPACQEFHPLSYIYCTHTGEKIEIAKRKKQLEEEFRKKHPLRISMYLLITIPILIFLNWGLWIIPELQKIEDYVPFKVKTFWILSAMFSAIVLLLAGQIQLSIQNVRSRKYVKANL